MSRVNRNLRTGRYWYLIHIGRTFRTKNFLNFAGRIRRIQADFRLVPSVGTLLVPSVLLKKKNSIRRRGGSRVRVDVGHTCIDPCTHLLIIGVHSRKSASPARRVGPEMANVPTLFATAVAAVV